MQIDKTYFINLFKNTSENDILGRRVIGKVCLQEHNYCIPTCYLLNIIKKDKSTDKTCLSMNPKQKFK